jgi:hypothetical protein
LPPRGESDPSNSLDLGGNLAKGTITPNLWFDTEAEG